LQLGGKLFRDVDNCAEFPDSAATVCLIHQAEIQKDCFMS
jgi:hypothetical protein